MFLLADFQWREAWHRGEVRGKGEGKKRTRRTIGEEKEGENRGKERKREETGGKGEGLLLRGNERE